MARQICFVSGVTGVGKTTRIKDFVANRPGWQRISGGDMIMRAIGQLPEAERDKLRIMTGPMARHHQRLLLKNFLEVAAETPENIVFDGQCAVRATDGILRPIPASITVRMKVTKVIYLDETVEVVLGRRKTDAERPGREDETWEQIADRMNVSEEICRRYAAKAGVPFVMLKQATAESFAAAVLG